MQFNFVSIWDIDNCLCDDRPRHHLIDHSKVGDERYAAYNEGMLDDVPCHRAQFDLMLALGATPIFFTGRAEMYREKTRMYLQRHFDVAYPILRMRPNGTVGLTPAVLKARMLAELLKDVPRDRILGAFDDVEAVIQTYRSFGIPAAVLRVYDPAIVYDATDLALPR
jgi:hypothetical protein